MNFRQAYSKLNLNQKTAVDTLDGPVLVLAGPGTGKTQVLMLRIANILKKTDSPPDSILALTFTESAAQEMRQRLIDLIGPLAYQVNIHTFHAFCQGVIRENPDKFIISTNSQALSDLERIQIFEKIITSRTNLEALRPINSPLYYAKAAESSIKDLKRENVSPKDFKNVLSQQEKEIESSKENISKTKLNQLQKDLIKNKELYKIYKDYQKEIVSRGLFDFEDMINLVVNNLEKDQDLLLFYQEKLNFILVDEYQDTNSAQNKLIFNLSSYWGEKANIFVVGDPNQSIFRFQGSSLENTKEFLSRFPHSILINLNQNYRSTQLILNSAHSLINNNQSLSKAMKNSPLESAVSLTKQPQITTVQFSHSLFEDYFIATQVKKLIKSGLPASNIAIIVRHNQDILDLSETLSRLDIPYAAQSSINILEDTLIKQFLKLLKITNSILTDSSGIELFTVLNYDFLNLNSFEILRLAKLSSNSRQDIATTVLLNKEIDLKIKDFFRKLSRWQKIANNKTLPEFFQIIFKESGLLNYLLSRKSSGYLEAFSSLFQLVKLYSQVDRDLNLNQFLENISLMQSQNISVPFSNFVHIKNAVTLTTAHKAKGQEWDSVFIYRSCDGKWGNSRARNLIKLPSSILEFAEQEEDPLSEERRLFYVALTRAKRKIFISSSQKYSTLYGEKLSLPSLFISELPDKNLFKPSPKKIHSQGQKIKKLFITLPLEQKITGNEKEYLKHLLVSFKLSITALNTYLECAYKFKLNNLYRIPRAKEPYLAFGTAVHKALEKFYKELSPRKNYLLAQFKSALKQEILVPHEYKSRLKHGRAVLSAYFDFHKNDFSSALLTEKFFGSSVYSHSLLGDISLTGKVDRVDVIGVSGRTVKVIDYKTGKRKTHGEIEGTTQNSNGSYKRQLIFYQLLADLDKRFPYKVIEAELDFVETPYKEKKSGKEIFKITSEEVKNLKKIINSTMKKIHSLKFEKTTDLSICNRCEFKDHCWPTGMKSS